MSFFCYCSQCPIDPKRPWQVLSGIGAVCGKFNSEEKARSAIEALTKDKEAGILPCNLATWDKRHLLEA